VEAAFCGLDIVGVTADMQSVGYGVRKGRRADAFPDDAIET
jgi:hypothetical protein